VISLALLCCGAPLNSVKSPSLFQNLQDTFHSSRSKLTRYCVGSRLDCCSLAYLVTNLPSAEEIRITTLRLRLAKRSFVKRVGDFHTFIPWTYLATTSLETELLNQAPSMSFQPSEQALQELIVTLRGSTNPSAEVQRQTQEVRLYRRYICTRTSSSSYLLVSSD
jgi:hypothetical protein